MGVFLRERILSLIIGWQLEAKTRRLSAIVFFAMLHSMTTLLEVVAHFAGCSFLSVILVRLVVQYNFTFCFL